jgi:hypothetical protein
VKPTVLIHEVGGLLGAEDAVALVHDLLQVRTPHRAVDEIREPESVRDDLVEEDPTHRGDLA